MDTESVVFINPNNILVIEETRDIGCDVIMVGQYSIHLSQLERVDFMHQLEGKPVVKKTDKLLYVVDRVIGYLNTVMNTKYSPRSHIDKLSKIISKYRDTNNSSAERQFYYDAKLIIDYYSVEWDNEKMRQYINPVSLFVPTKFFDKLEIAKNNNPKDGDSLGDVQICQ